MTDSRHLSAAFWAKRYLMHFTESLSFVPGKEVQAPRSQTQEDPSAASPAQQARRESEDPETAEERPLVLHAQICCQGIEAFSINKMCLSICSSVAVNL